MIETNDRPPGVLRMKDLKPRFPGVPLPTLYRYAPQLPGYFRLGRLILFKEKLLDEFLAGGGEIPAS